MRINYILNTLLWLILSTFLLSACFVSPSHRNRTVDEHTNNDPNTPPDKDPKDPINNDPNGPTNKDPNDPNAQKNNNDENNNKKPEPLKLEKTPDAKPIPPAPTPPVPLTPRTTKLDNAPPTQLNLLESLSNFDKSKLKLVVTPRINENKGDGSVEHSIKNKMVEAVEEKIKTLQRQVSQPLFNNEPGNTNSLMLKTANDDDRITFKDLPYLLERAKAYGLGEQFKEVFEELGKVKENEKIKRVLVRALTEAAMTERRSLEENVNEAEKLLSNFKAYKNHDSYQEMDNLLTEIKSKKARVEDTPAVRDNDEKVLVEAVYKNEYDHAQPENRKKLLNIVMKLDKLKTNEYTPIIRDYEDIKKILEGISDEPRREIEERCKKTDPEFSLDKEKVKLYDLYNKFKNDALDEDNKNQLTALINKLLKKED